MALTPQIAWWHQRGWALKAGSRQQGLFICGLGMTVITHCLQPNNTSGANVTLNKTELLKWLSSQIPEKAIMEVTASVEESVDNMSLYNAGSPNPVVSCYVLAGEAVIRWKYST